MKLAVFALLAAALAHGQACQAQPEWFGIGTRINHIAPLSAAARASLGPNYGDEYALGFGYETVRLFGLDVWTWNGRFCIYAGARCDYVDPQRGAEVLGNAGEELRVPLGYRLPPGFMLMLLVLGATIVVARRQARTRAADSGVSDDPRYQHALSIVMRDSAGLSGSELRARTNRNLPDGLAYLRSEGIDAQDAARNLRRMIDTLVQFRTRA